MREGSRLGREEEAGAVKQRAAGAAAGPFGPGSGIKADRRPGAVEREIELRNSSSSSSPEGSGG